MKSVLPAPQAPSRKSFEASEFLARPLQHMSEPRLTVMTRCRKRPCDGRAARPRRPRRRGAGGPPAVPWHFAPGRHLAPAALLRVDGARRSLPGSRPRNPVDNLAGRIARPEDSVAPGHRVDPEGPLFSWLLDLGSGASSSATSSRGVTAGTGDCSKSCTLRVTTRSERVCSAAAATTASYTGVVCHVWHGSSRIRHGVSCAHPAEMPPWAGP